MAKELREYRVLLEKVPAGERAVTDPRALGVRSKFGGRPDWEQDDATPACRECGGVMTFVAQLDSIEHDEDHNPHRVDAMSPDQQFMFGDVGMFYVFFCADCLRAEAVFQCG